MSRFFRLAFLWAIICRVGIFVSQTINFLTGGVLGETVCSRMWGKKLNGSKFGNFTVRVLDRMFFLEPNHCERSYYDRHPKPTLSPETEIS